MPSVRLGNSGLKISRIVLGCMSYGTPEWEPWVLGEEESIKQIKAAYVINVPATYLPPLYLPIDMMLESTRSTQRTQVSFR